MGLAWVVKKKQLLTFTPRLKSHLGHVFPSWADQGWQGTSSLTLTSVLENGMRCFQESHPQMLGCVTHQKWVTYRRKNYSPLNSQLGSSHMMAHRQLYIITLHLCFGLCSFPSSMLLEEVGSSIGRYTNHFCDHVLFGAY